MTRPISIASGVSVIAHIGLFVAVGLLFAKVDLSDLTTLPVLTLNLLPAQQAEQSPEPATESTVAEETRALDSQPTPAPPVPVQASLPPADQIGTVRTATAISNVDQRRSTEIAGADERIEVLTGTPQPAEPASEPAQSPTQSDIVTTSAPAPVRVASAVSHDPLSVPAETVSMSPRQQKMLDKRVRKWSRNIDELSQAEIGVEWKHRGQVYKATFEARPARNDTDLEHVLVKVSTRQDGEQLTTELLMRRLAFSNYGQFVNRWDPRVQIHDDVIDGRFHSNSDVNLSYSRKVRPTFRGRVTIAGHGIKIGESQGFVTRAEMFRGGLETGVRTIALPKRFVPFPADRRADEEQVHKFKQHTRVRFHADGSYTWGPLSNAAAGQRRKLPDRTAYLIADGRARLHVEGTVNGKVLVYSPDRIVIEGNLVYADDPRSNAGSDDYLGLVSERSIEVADAEVTGPGDLSIHAAVYTKRRFSVDGFQKRNNDLLYLYGSLTAGSVDATEPRFRTEIEFDNRLETIRPPAFPMTSRFEVIESDGEWQAD